MPVFIDLFSGLGGASAAFKDAGWDVVRVDINPKFRPDIIADITTLSLRCHADVVWASPPCTEFTHRRLPAQWKCNNGVHTEPSMILVKASKRIIDEINPQFWIIENVPGAYPYITPYLHMEPKRIGSRYLWGDFPITDPEPTHNKWKMSPSKDRHEKRSKIPRNISVALLKSISLYPRNAAAVPSRRQHGGTDEREGYQV